MRSAIFGRHLIASVVMLLGVTLVLGFGYPLVVTGLSQLFFHQQANGSLIYRDGKLVGSALLGQEFTDSKGNPLPQYFQPRPSDAGAGYDAYVVGCEQPRPVEPAAHRVRGGREHGRAERPAVGDQPVRDPRPTRRASPPTRRETR